MGWPAAPVWCVTSREPRNSVATAFRAASPVTLRTPPALPRPPACTCALTTQWSPPSVRAAARASSGVVATMPWGTATP